MFYYMAKVLWFLATPSNLLPAIGGLGVVLMLTRLRGVGLALAGVVAMRRSRRGRAFSSNVE